MPTSVASARARDRIDDDPLRRHGEWHIITHLSHRAATIMIRMGHLPRYVAAPALAVTSSVSLISAQAPPPHRADVVYEASITDLQAAMTQGRVTSVGLVDAYIARINAYDHHGPALNAIIRLNPRARADAAALDTERKAGRVRGPLHGIPIILKDNYSTTDMATSAGTIALAGLETPTDAFQVRKLRDAGAVILAKSNMHELASGITTISSIGGQTCNPYDPDRLPGGSSGGSGAAVAASFAPIAWGSDTCGSIRIPSAVHNLFGLRPTKGLSSISGIVPLSHTQDVGGPIARTVRDLAIGLDATVGADPADAATEVLTTPPPKFIVALDSTALRGKRLGVITAHFGTEADDQEGGRVVRAALDKMKARGAEVVDVTIPGLDSAINAAGVIDYELKPDLIDFLAPIPNAPVKSLGEILEKGLYHTQLETGLRRRERMGTRDGDAYHAALAMRTTSRDLVVAFLDANKLDALVYPTVRRKAALIGEPQRGANCQLSAVTGLPALSMPAGFTPDGLPIGVELLGRPLADARLVAMAYDYEQSAHPRRAPSTTPALVDGRAPKPTMFSVTARGTGAVAAHGDLAFDASRRSLDYAVRVSGVAASRVFAVSIDRDSAGKKGPVLLRLSGPGATQSKGTLTLGESERRDLLAGRMALVLYTTDQPSGMVRASIRP